MKNVILSDEKIDIIRNKVREEADPYSITNESIDYNDLLDKELIKAQARHLLRILKERYTCGVKDDMANGWIMISPEQLAEIEKEIEG